MNAFARPVSGACGPRQRSRNSPLRVDADGLDALVLDQVLDQLDLVGLVLAQVALDRLAGGDLGALERLVGLDVLAHLRLDLLEVALVDRDAGRELEVVVEAVGDRRADRHLGARIELEHRLGQHVRDVVAQELQRVAVARLGGDDLDRLRRRRAAATRSTIRPSS